MALGARRADVLGLVMRRSMFLTTLGLVLGLVLAFGMTRALANALFEVSAHDPVTFAAVALILAAAALSASYIPARRATRVDPVVALRYE
jgi:putative ABC transport system permease protein